MSAKKILFVDDSRAMRDAIGRFLRFAGFEVCMAVDGGDALQKLAKTKVDIIVTDNDMPNMGGCELAQKSKELYPDTPVLMITGGLPPRDESIDLILRKPFDNNLLIAGIDRLLMKL